MMGDTGPCGPCSELHVDLTPAGDTKGALVNKGDARCIEIWNLVFIQFNANPDGTFSPLPAKHVDTGMGFERVTSIIQGTKNLTDFAHAKISNYETDIFRPIFDDLEKMSGKTYRSTLPGGQNETPIQQKGELTHLKDELTHPKSDSIHLKDESTHEKHDLTHQKGGSTHPKGDLTHQKDESTQLQGALTQQKHESVHQIDESAVQTDQIALDIAFRVIADHIRTLSFAIADGIQPGNNDRNYVLRRILRRAVRYGRTLGFKEPFFYKLVDVLADTMGDVFPEIRARKKQVQETIRTEEEAFNKTLDGGIEVFNLVLNRRSELISEIAKICNQVEKIRKGFGTISNKQGALKDFIQTTASDFILLVGFTIDVCHQDFAKFFGGEVYELQSVSKRLGQTSPTVSELAFGDDAPSRKNFEDLLGKLDSTLDALQTQVKQFPGRASFVLYDTYGFPFDLTELMARERGLTVDKDDFDKLMEEQRARARAAQKKEVISLSQIETTTPTKFVGYDNDEVLAKVLEVVSLKDKTAVILDTSVCYAEMGGQVGDRGYLSVGNDKWHIANTQKSGNTWLHILETQETHEAVEKLLSAIGVEEVKNVKLNEFLVIGSEVKVSVSRRRRRAIERHHTVTHLLHWALHEVASKEASQKGSFVGPDKLTFDFNSAPLTPQQVADVEKLVNERILENAGVSWTEVPHADVKNRKDVMQFFGDKYGDTVRVVQIGGRAGELDGYSMELCGGTHTRATGEIGLFRIVGESAIAAGVRRIEAVAGLTAYDLANEQLQLIKSIAGKINSPLHELEKKVELLLAHQKALEKEVQIAMQRNASNAASELLGRAQAVNGIPLITHNLGEAEPEFLQAIADALKGRFQGVVVLGGHKVGAVTLICAVTPEFTAKVQAGKIIQQIAPIVGGKGGGRPDNARGGGKDFTKLDDALAKAKSLI